MKHFLLIISITTFFFTCCKEKPTIEIEYFENGKIKSKTQTIKGRKSGPRFEYYPDGSPKAEIDFENDIMNGKSLKYYPNHQLAEDFRYYRGKMVGINRFFLRNGMLKEVREYDSLGQLVSLITYKSDGEIDFENVSPIVYANRDTFRINDTVTVHAHLANADPRLYKKGSLVVTSGFEDKVAKDTLQLINSNNFEGFRYQFSANKVGAQKVNGVLIFPLQTDSALVHAIFNFEMSYYVESSPSR